MNRGPGETDSQATVDRHVVTVGTSEVGSLRRETGIDRGRRLMQLRVVSDTFYAQDASRLPLEVERLLEIPS